MSPVEEALGKEAAPAVRRLLAKKLELAAHHLQSLAKRVEAHADKPWPQESGDGDVQEVRRLLAQAEELARMFIGERWEFRRSSP